MSLSDTIRIARKKAFYTQEKFAEELEVSKATINRWEKGKSKPNIEAMKKIKAFCDNTGFPYEAIEKEWIG